MGPPRNRYKWNDMGPFLNGHHQGLTDHSGWRPTLHCQAHGSKQGSKGCWLSCLIFKAICSIQSSWRLIHLILGTKMRIGLTWCLVMFIAFCGQFLWRLWTWILEDQVTNMGVSRGFYHHKSMMFTNFLFDDWNHFHVSSSALAWKKPPVSHYGHC